MHKLRNTAHKALLEKMYAKYGEKVGISKRQLRYLLATRNWDKWKVMDMIEKDEWWAHFVDE